VVVVEPEKIPVAFQGRVTGLEIYETVVFEVDALYLERRVIEQPAQDRKRALAVEDLDI
jgi:hypothetical protein